MTYSEYKAKRDTLMNEAQALVDEGKLEAFEEKTAEVEALDEEWDKI